MIDIQTSNIIRLFESIIVEYKPFDKNDLRKYYHSLEVYELSLVIAKELKFNKRETMILEVISIFHDIGRFIENQIFQNIDDKVEFDHAKESVNILSNNKKFLDFLEKENLTDQKEIIEKSIYYHNKIDIDDNLNKKYLNILMDADKISILHLVSDSKIVPLKFDIPTPKCYNTFENLGLIPNKEIKNISDRLLKYLSFIFHFNYDYSLTILKSRKYIDKILNTIQFVSLNRKDEIESNINKFITNKRSVFVND